MFTFLVFFPLVILIIGCIVAWKFNLFSVLEDKEVFVIPISVVVGLVLFSFIGYWIGTSHSRFNEVWNYKGVSMKYEERWNELHTYTVEVADGTDKDGNTTYHTETRTEIVDYGPYWKLYDEYGSETSISEGEYNDWKNIWWKNEKKVGHHSGYSISGNIYEITWDGSFDKIYPMSSIKTYVNKVRACKNSVLRYAEASEELKKKFPRPADENNASPVIQYGFNYFSNDDMLYLRRVNAHLGPRNLIHPMFVIFDSGVGMGIVNDVMSAWQGPNKNELVIFLGVNKDTKNIDLVKCESWMDNTTIYGYISDGLLNKKINAMDMGETLMVNVPKYWHKKSFKDFDYLQVEMSGWGYIFVIVMDIIGMIGILVWGFAEKGDNSGYCMNRWGNRRFNRWG